VENLCRKLGKPCRISEVSSHVGPNKKRVLPDAGKVGEGGNRTTGKKGLSKASRKAGQIFTGQKTHEVQGGRAKTARTW